MATSQNKPVSQRPAMESRVATNDPDAIRFLNTPQNIIKELNEEWESIMTLRSRVSATSRPAACITSSTVIGLNKQLQVFKAHEITSI